MDYYLWCQVLHDYMYDYGFGALDFYEPEFVNDRSFLVETLYGWLGHPDWGGNLVCPQFIDRWPDDPTATPLPESQRELDWTEEDIRFIASLLFSILADPDYPGTELRFDSQDYWLWCQILHDYAPYHTSDYFESRPDELMVVLQNEFVTKPISRGREPICEQFVEINVEPSATPTYSPYPQLEHWEDEDLGFVKSFYRHIVTDPEFPDPDLYTTIPEKYLICQFIWEYGLEYGYDKSVISIEEQWEYLYSWLGTWYQDKPPLCPQFESGVMKPTSTPDNSS
jgi:hypothetical protein